MKIQESYTDENFIIWLKQFPTKRKEEGYSIVTFHKYKNRWRSFFDMGQLFLDDCIAEHFFGKKTPEKLADEIIKQMQESGLTYDEMLEVIKLAKEKLFLYETKKH